MHYNDCKSDMNIIPLITVLHNDMNITPLISILKICFLVLITTMTNIMHQSLEIGYQQQRNRNIKSNQNEDNWNIITFMVKLADFDGVGAGYADDGNTFAL